MQLHPDKLDGHLTHHLRPIYHLSGDEPLQLGECADRIRRKARELGHIGREVYVGDADLNWEHFIGAADNMSLFAEKRILELRLEKGRPGREGGEALKAYAQRPADDAVLLVTSGKVDGAGKLTAWYKALDKVGMMIQVWPVAAHELPTWVTKRMQMQGLRPTRDAATLIADRVEGNMLAAQQEINKLALLFADCEINVQEVLAVVTDSARYQTFDLANAALLGNAGRVISILDGLRGEGIDPVPVLFALTMQIRSAAQAAQALAMRRSLPEALRAAGIRRHLQGMFQRALGHHNLRGWEQMLQRCAELELATKGLARRGNLWDELLELALVLAGQLTLEQVPFCAVE